MILTCQKTEIVKRLNNLHVTGILYNGQFYDAYSFISILFNQASKRIYIIDDDIDDTFLKYFESLDDRVDKKIYTYSQNLILRHDIALHNIQYSPIKLQFYHKHYDSFIIIDNKVFYVSEPLNDLGKKLCSISLMKTISGDVILNDINYN